MSLNTYTDEQLLGELHQRSILLKAKKCSFCKRELEWCDCQLGNVPGRARTYQKLFDMFSTLFNTLIKTE